MRWEATGSDIKQVLDPDTDVTFFIIYASGCNQDQNVGDQVEQGRTAKARGLTLSSSGEVVFHSS